MSGPARRRGAGRAGGSAEGSSETSSRRGDRLAPSGFDGPASRGSASGTGSQGRRPSNAPSVGSGRGSPNTSQGGAAAPQAPSQTSVPSQLPSQAQTGAALQGDPARDVQPRYTDSLRNIDLPASFYEIDKLVSLKPETATLPMSVSGQTFPDPFPSFNA